MFQVNYSYGKSAHLPYTAAALVSYAMADKKIADEYELCDIFFLRNSIDEIIGNIVSPDVIGFSTYIWNFEFNKAAAKKIKSLYPNCTVIFGGHHVSPGGSLLEQCPYIDYLIHGEGEESFRRLLAGDPPSDIPGVSYRADKGVITNEASVCNDEYIDYPSPYLGGYFDKILSQNPDTDFMALIETTRGCPNSCSYCDWSNMKSRIRKFPLQRVLDEIRWISEHHILGLGSADSNFGLLERDEVITDFIIEMNQKNKYPIGYQTSYAKNSNDRIFRIGQSLESHGMSKGITLSFQSMSETVLKNIGRHNIPISHYSELIKMYNEAGIATYTELILGLPGETYESFADGIDKLLNLGQHNSIYIHNCEWLPCSQMGDYEYIKKFGISTSLIALNQPHIENTANDEIPEKSRLVTSTCSMTCNDWMRMNVFSFTVQCFHHMGLLSFFALYLHYKKEISYRDFYEQLVEWLHKGTSDAHKAIKNIENRLSDIVSGKPDSSFVYIDQRFGSVHWPFEEYLYLCTVYDSDSFYSNISDFLSSFSIEPELFDELLRFQREMVKKPFDTDKELSFKYDFLTFYRDLFAGKPTSLVKRDNVVHINAKSYDTWQDYAKSVVWYGRKDNKNVYINESTAMYK